MRTLLIHADSFEYHLKEKTKMAEDWSEDQKSASFREVLVVFVTVEKRDSDVDAIAR